ncbi:hypothetical protein Avbf_12121 [Armadillidium vulgare]|nr:hypothetical protein Avbf_12121 [Armadillidium vulgare]
MVDPSLFASDLRQRTKPYVVGYSDARSSYVSPPIPGYTGYIPHMKCTEVGIGRTYGAAARKGDERPTKNASQPLQSRHFLANVKGFREEPNPLYEVRGGSEPFTMSAR